MRKYLIPVLIALVLCEFQAGAVSRKDKKKVEQENAELRAQLDSLHKVLDSLKLQIPAPVLEDTVAVVINGANEDILAISTPERSQAETDSLLDLWYRNVLNVRDTVALPIPTEGYHSDVSDEVMISRLEDINACITLPFNNTVKDYMVLYSEKMRKSMGKVISLADYYFPIFDEVFSRRGLPLELKYLAVVESTLKPTARSRSGATGMWQLMYRTATSYGLVIDSYVDERMDVEKSTEAAASYLEDAYQVFGDWALAICAYNCGPGNVNKAIKRADGARDFWSIYPYLPKETRGYVPAFVGVMYAMTYYKEYGIERVDMGLPAQVDTFHIGKNLHFRQISEIAGIPLEEIEAVNPKYIRSIVPGSGSISVLNLPYKWSGAFMDNHSEEMYNYKAQELFTSKVNKGKNNIKIPEKPRQKTDLSQFDGYTWYTVQAGDSYYSIAREYVGVSAFNIMDYNGMTSTSLKPGMKLKIPVPKNL